MNLPDGITREDVLEALRDLDAGLAYVELTNDLDFGAILAATRADGPSVLQMRTESVSPRSLGDRLLKELVRFEVDRDRLDGHARIMRGRAGNG